MLARRMGPLVIVALLATVACQPQDQEAQQTSATDTAAVRAAIDSLRGAFESAFQAGDAEAMASFYAEDAVYSAPGEPPAEGREAIRDVIERTHPPDATIDISPSDLVVLDGERVFEFGTGTMTFTPEGAEQSVEVSSNYSLLVRNTDEGWKLWREALSSNAPPPGS